MFTATVRDESVTWDGGELSGDRALVNEIRLLLLQPDATVVYNYWGERPASISGEFDAYITIGDVLSQTGDPVVFDNIPDNPDGYEEEGVVPDDVPDESFGWIEFYNHNHDAKDGRFTSGAKGGAAFRTRQPHKIITKEEARGDSRPVSLDEFNRLATIGRRQLSEMARLSSPTTGLNENWSKIKADAYAEVRKPWGGATIDAHTGKALEQGVNAYAITVKGVKAKTISVHENATEAEFNAAMDKAKKEFGPILERQGHHLGVFHDDANHRIDIDPVLVVRKHADVETIGAASHSIGGAYNFKDGNGYWPPHVDTSPTATNKHDDIERTLYAGGQHMTDIQTSFPGPGAWRSQAAELEADDEVDEEAEAE